MREQPKTFNAAVDAFQWHLAAQGYSDGICWVFREDVLIHRGEIWIGSPLPKSNPQYARKLYYVGKQRGLGLTLACLAQVGRQSACYIQVPRDAEDADSMKLRGDTEFRGPDSDATACFAPRNLSWRIRKWKRDKRLNHLPRRTVLGSDLIPADILPPSTPKRLFVVEDAFTIKGRGIILLPGVRIDEHGPFAREEVIFKIGDKVELRRPDGSVLTTEIVGSDFLSAARLQGNSPEQPRHVAIRLALSLERTDVPPGTEVWIAGE
jgi:hypothetical protein